MKGHGGRWPIPAASPHHPPMRHPHHHHWETLPFSQLIAVDMMSVASLTVIVYHHLITLDDEINWMWTLRTSLAKVLFLGNRYVVESMLIFSCIASLYTHHSNKFCDFLVRWLAFTFVVSSALVQCILIIRVWALYRRNIVVVSVAISVYIGGLIILLGFNLKSLFVPSIPIGFPVFRACHSTGLLTFSGTFWITPVIVQNLLLALVAYKRYRWWRNGYPVMGLFSILSTDSLIYFTTVFVLLVVNLLMITFGPPLLSTLFIRPSTAAGCLLGSHMLMCLRARESNDDTDPEDPSASLDFIPLENLQRRNRSRPDFNADD